MLLHTSCNSIYNPLMFLIGDCCGCARVASDPDLIQSKCLGWEWLHAWESPMRIWLQVDNHRSQCSVLHIYTRWAVHVLHELRDIHTVLAIHQPHNLACQGPKCVVAGSSENILSKLGKLYLYLILFVKVLVKQTWLMYRTAPPSLWLSAEDRLLNSRQDMNRVRSESGGHPLSLCCHDLADTDTFVYIFLL